MKNIKQIFIYLFASLVCVSCTDLLTENPKSFVAPEAYYKTDAEANGGAVGCYKGVAELYKGINNDITFISLQGTDICRPTGGRDGDYPYNVYTMSATLESSFPSLWLNFYRGVADANNLIDQVSASKAISQAVKDQIVAEGKFYRAIYYYWLTGFWGDVPYFNKFDITYAVSGVKKTPVSTIRKSMIADLEACADQLPNTSTIGYRGRPTKWAAKVLLCKYYQWEHDWAKCSSLCQDIINQSPHKLVVDYANLWGLKNEYNLESIWELDYVATINLTARSTNCCPRAADEPGFVDPKDPLKSVFQGYGLLTATNEFVASFNSKDKRRIWYRWLDGDPRINIKFNYVAKFLDQPSELIRGNSGINFVAYRLADVYLMLAEAENEANNGPTALAYSSINKIRTRAGLGDLSGLNYDTFFDAIYNERKWELGFEDHRRLDLCRWHKLVDAVKSISNTNPIGAANVKSIHELFPIPSNEIQNNPNLLPNNGY